MKKGFFKGGRASSLGVPLVPFEPAFSAAGGRSSRAAGSEVRLGTGALSVSKDAKAVTLEGGETLEADAVVVALTPWLAAKQFEAKLAEKLGLKEAASMEASPILTAHVFTEKPFLPEPLCAFAPEDGDLGFEFHWAFDRTALSGEKGPAGSTWNCFVSSAAKRMAGMSQEAILMELKRQLLKRLKSYDPEAVTHSLVLKEARATPLFEPGASRLSQRAKLPEFSLGRGLDRHGPSGHD